jgi:TetR/AcrR family transcriptional regulator, regulator of cefoperazone and chloramphenicol sensitivity
MTRPSDFTRDRILRAAVRLFAERGYDATSIRTLAAKARINQAAVNYHFKSKEGLYREVLREAIRALTQHQLSHAQETQAMPRERALGEFVRDQLRPLSARDDVSRYIHILNWEAVRPTTVYRKLVSEEAAPFMGFAVDLMRRFMPDADRSTLVMAAVWLVGQCNVFIRYRDQLAIPPVSLTLDEPGLQNLSTLISAWALAGLAQANTSNAF